MIGLKNRFFKIATRKASTLSSPLYNGYSKRSLLVGGSLLAGLGTAFYCYSTYASAVAAALNPKEFRSFKLAKVTPVNHNTSLFTFDLESKDQELGLPVASCIIVKSPKLNDANGNPVIRPYTPLYDDQKGHFELLIKRYDTGALSKHFHELQVGDSIDVKGPIQKIDVKENFKKHIGLIAGGTGLTPMLQVINHILKNPNDKTQITFLFANIAEEDILLKSQLDELQSKHKNFKVEYVLEKPPKNWNGGVGYVNKDLIKKYLPPPSDDHMIMVCGPPGMMNSITGPKAPDYSQGELSGILKEMGYTKEQVFKF